MYDDPKVRNFRSKNDTGFADCRGAANTVKAGVLDAYRAAKTPTDSTRQAKQSERAAAAEARDRRRAERKQAKTLEQARVEVKAAERQAAEAAAAEIEIATCHKEGQNRIARGD